MSELAPMAHTIHSLISQRWNVHEALAELVDNACAPGKGGADAIWIDVGHDRILIWDHGRGVDDLNRLFQLGNTSSWEDHSDIGLYGVGATEASIWLGGLLKVTTVRDGRLLFHQTDWDACIKHDRWASANTGDGKRARRDNVPCQLLVDGKVSSGTLIEVVRKRRGRRNFKMAALMDRLGFTFGPGLRNGKQIFVRRHGGEWFRKHFTVTLHSCPHHSGPISLHTLSPPLTLQRSRPIGNRRRAAVHKGGGAARIAAPGVGQHRCQPRRLVE